MRTLGLVVVLIAVGCGPAAKHGGADDAIDAPSGTTPDAPACATSSSMATEAVRPVDIIWVIDNSGSMDAEEARVQNNMNAFATSIAASGVDYHVIVIASTSNVNVPPPLGGSPQLLAVNVGIDSHNALEKVVSTYPTYKAFLRPSSVKHIVAVSDDESGWSKTMFESQLAALTGPGFGMDWRFHAVVAEALPINPSNHCFLLSAAVGATYIGLQQAHGGLFFSLCDTNWSPLFTALAQTVTQGLSLPCTFSLPTPPAGQTLDPTKINFVYTPATGPAVTIVNVGSSAGCNGGPGWYYDNAAAPTQIITCPATCSTLEADPSGKVEVQLGCNTVIL